MSFSKLAPIILYVSMAISVVVVGFFYFGENLVNKADFESKVAKIENPVEDKQIVNMAQDLQSADSLATEANDSTQLAEGDTSQVAENVAVETIEDAAKVVETPVKFTFLEKLVYYRTDIALVWGYLLVLITGLVALVLPLIFMFTNPTNMVRTLLGLVGVAVLVGLAFLLASGDPMVIPGYNGTDNTNPTVLRYVGTGLFITYFFLGITVLAILYSEIAKYFK